MSLLRPDELASLRQSQAYVRYKIALLIDKFGLRPWELARLTDRQIIGYYFHKRNKDGLLELDLPAESITESASTLESELAALSRLHALVNLANYDESVQALHRKYGKDVS